MKCSASNTFHTHNVVLDTLCIYTIGKGISACKYFTEFQLHENFFSYKLGLSLTRMKCRQQFRAIFNEVLHLTICFHSCKVWSTHEMTIFSTRRSFSKAVTNCYRLLSMNTFHVPSDNQWFFIPCRLAYVWVSVPLLYFFLFSFSQCIIAHQWAMNSSFIHRQIVFSGYFAWCFDVFFNWYTQFIFEGKWRRLADLCISWS